MTFLPGPCVDSRVGLSPVGPGTRILRRRGNWTSMLLPPMGAVSPYSSCSPEEGGRVGNRRIGQGVRAGINLWLPSMTSRSRPASRWSSHRIARSSPTLI